MGEKKRMTIKFSNQKLEMENVVVLQTNLLEKKKWKTEISKH